ncbi:hypothetical protein T484DRAFT_1756874 [Cryptophyta sp. CCMP2293]|nr:hypothetical protein T484DRAFT_1756874 [Cryptophyta sp. CCMP2293]
MRERAKHQGKSTTSRFLPIMQLIQTTSTLYRLPSVRFYVYICDTYCYEFRDLPLFVIAKPSNREGILMPDDTFTGEVSWEQSCASIHQNSCSPEKKIPIIYFKGARTGARYRMEKKYNKVIEDHKWGTRCIFEAYAIESKIMQVNIDGMHEPMHTWCKYKYLLNMPGHQPWSYRFKYLLTMQSLVIDIVVHQQYGSDTSDYNTRWNNFFDAFIRHNRDYVQVPLRWVEGDDAHNEREHIRVIQRVYKIFAYFEKNAQAYRDMVDSCTRRLTRISQAAVYHGMSVVINEYADAIRSASIPDVDTRLGLVMDTPVTPARGVKRRAANSTTRP